MPNNVYRNRKEPYTDVELGLNEQQSALRVYFQTHQPGEYRFQPALVDAFMNIYGKDAKDTLINHMTVPENTTESWVTKPVYQDTIPVDANPEHKGQHKINTPFGEKWVDDVPIDPSKYSDGERAILNKLDEILNIIKK
jgi:hypothetical protein